MCDIFTSKNCKETFKNMFILMIGDSNMKSFYKDLIYLISHNNIGEQAYFMNPPKSNKRKSFCGDQIIALNETTTGRDYFEEREFKDIGSGIRIRLNLITNVYGRSMMRMLRDIEQKVLPMPNVIIVNSCLWDLTRWGPKREEQYMKNLITLFGEMKRIIPPSVLTIWTTTPPLSCSVVKGGVFIQQLEFTKHTMRFMIIEANSFVRKLCILFDRDLLDVHYHLRYQVHRRSIDGIHWEPHCIRHVVCLLLTHMALSFNKPLPGNFKNDIVADTTRLRDRKCNSLDVSMPADLREKVNEYLKVSEPIATVSLNTILMKEATDAKNGETEPVRRNKKVRRRLAPLQPSAANHNRPGERPSAANQPCQMRPSNLNSRLNFANVHPQHPRASSRQLDGPNQTQFGNNSYQPVNHFRNENRRHMPHHEMPPQNYQQQYYPHHQMSPLYDPKFWHTLLTFGAGGNQYIQQYPYNRRYQPF